MATGNLFLGLGRRSVGDVTLYRRNGKQISRVRVRKIANPSTAKQVYSRAIAATVTKAYKAGHAIFDHSFEGYKVPSGAQARFLSLNMRLLRQLTASDIAEQRDSFTSQAYFVPRGSTVPAVGRFVVSEGSLVQDFITLTIPDAEHDASMIRFGATTPEQGQLLKDYIANNGVRAGDIFTIVMMAYDELNMVGLTPACQFGFIRLVAKDLSSSTALAASSYVADAFYVSSSDNIANCAFKQMEDTDFGNPFQISSFSCVSWRGWSSAPGLVAWQGVAAVIASRQDSGLRSNAQFIPVGLNDSGYTGLIWSNVVQGWSDNGNVGESELILEGGDGGNF